MQINTIVCGVLISLLTSCQTSIPKYVRWLSPPTDQIVPRLSNKIASSNVFELTPAEEASAIEWMDREDLYIVPLTKVPDGLITSPSQAASDFYLIRAVSDDLSGIFTIYSDDEYMLVLYNHLGECGDLKQRALLVRSNKQATTLYGGCSGAL